MKKYDNEWSIETDVLLHDLEEFQKNWPDSICRVNINKTTYLIPEKLACITHAILLLVDVINDKDIKCQEKE